jgi:benzoyl-CoA reductase/2-hydroxyglutaryl-CoA dehydratase subunit BcrC/BadD/HgdB
MIGVPDELLRSFDVMVSLGENYGPVCAAKQVSDHFCGIAEGDGYSADLCSYLRTGIGYLSRLKEVGDAPPEAPYGGMGKPDMVIAPAMFCDGRYKYPQAARRYIDVPSFVYDVRDIPYWEYEEDPQAINRYIDYYYERLKELVAFLEKVTGRKYNPDKLSEHLDYWVKGHNIFRDACQFRQARPNPLPSQDSFAVCFPNLNYKGTKECLDYYQGLYDELKYMVDNKIGAIQDEKYRIFWFGLPPWYFLGIFNYMQDCGVCTLDRTYDPGDRIEDVDLSDPLYAVAKKCYDTLWFGSGQMRRQNFARLIADFVKEYEVDGVITLLATTCRMSTGMLHLRRLVNEWAGVPAINLEADMADVRTFSEAHIKARLDAFMETIDAAKGRRAG